MTRIFACPIFLLLITLLQNANLIRFRISKLTRTRISIPFNAEKKKIGFFSIEWPEIVFIYKFPFILLIEVTVATPAEQKGRSDNRKGKNLRNVESGWGLRHSLQRHLDKYTVTKNECKKHVKIGKKLPFKKS